jgi:hypothetical protein
VTDHRMTPFTVAGDSQTDFEPYSWTDRDADQPLIGTKKRPGEETHRKSSPNQCQER